MHPGLNYGQIYRLIITDEGYNGMYLGEAISPDRRDTTNLILVNKPFSWKERFKEINLEFSLIQFKEYRFNEKNKLILKNPTYVMRFTPSEKDYFENLLNKIPKD